MAVYFIQAGDGGPVKIGKADDPAARMQELQVAHWSDLTLMRVIDGGHAAERWLHRFYAPLRLRGEWFKFSECMGTINVPALAETRETPFKQYIKRIGGVGFFVVALGVTPAAVRYWAAGKRVPSRDMMKKIIKATNGAVRANDFYEAA